jgi:hypothetical protein
MKPRPLLWLAHLLLFTISVRSHCNPPPPPNDLNYGSCSNPGITYGWNIDNSQRYGYVPSDTTSFPHGWSPDIATIESFICNRLESPCNAPPDVVQRCREAFELYSGLSGDSAVESWNVALGLAPDHDQPPGPDDCPDDNYLTTTYVTLYVASSLTPTTIVDVDLTTTTLTQTLILTSTRGTTYTTLTTTTIAVDPVPQPSSTLTITVVLPSTTTTDQNAVTATLVVTEVSLATTTMDVTQSLVAQETASSDDGGGSPFTWLKNGAVSVRAEHALWLMGSLGVPMLALGFLT